MICDHCRRGCPDENGATCYCLCHQPKPRAFHYHGVDRSFDEDGHWASVEICAPADELEAIKVQRNAWLCTTPLFEVEGSFADCPIQTHAKCYPSCEPHRQAMQSYGGKLVSPGMSHSAYEEVERHRWLDCQICQSKVDSMYGEYCPGH